MFKFSFKSFNSLAFSDIARQTYP